MIECCGDLNLYVAKKFDGDLERAMKYLCEVDEVDTAAEWEEYYQPPSEEEDIETLYAKYVAENVPFARSIWINDDVPSAKTGHL